MKILIGYDGSACAQAALKDLAQAGLPEDAEVLVLGVAEVWLPPPPSGFEIAAAAGVAGLGIVPKYTQEARLLRLAETTAQEGVELVEKHFPRWRVSAAAQQGSPAWALIMKADQWQPDLMVVGSHGRSALGRLILGSVSQKVLAEARCSVRVARGLDFDKKTALRLLIGHDGSAAARLATQAVIARRWPPDTEIRVLTVQDALRPALAGSLLAPVADWLTEAERSGHDWARQVAEAAAAELRAAGLSAQAEVLAGDPKQVLVEEARNWGATSVFLGATGFNSRLERFMLGSVAAAVAARASCSVEVVRTAAHEC